MPSILVETRVNQFISGSNIWLTRIQCCRAGAGETENIIWRRIHDLQFCSALESTVNKVFYRLFILKFRPPLRRRYLFLNNHNQSWARDNSVATTTPCFQATKFSLLQYYCICLATLCRHRDLNIFSYFFLSLRLYFVVALSLSRS